MSALTKNMVKKNSHQNLESQSTPANNYLFKLHFFVLQVMVDTTAIPRSGQKKRQKSWSLVYNYYVILTQNMLEENP
jgi:hypothetical protein